MMSELPKKSGSRERVRAILADLDLLDGLHEFEPHSTKTAQQAADRMGCELGQIVKSLVLVADGVPVVALVAGDMRGDAEAIASELSAVKARMANAEEVREATGYAIGGVCPFGLPEELSVLADDSLLRFEVVFPAAGTPDSMVRMDRDRLFEIARARVARISHAG
jgi:prolyl-tRNA editing enzyme YbaK/EbsC (Cys-tRNA(Pro) deacylase)